MDDEAESLFFKAREIADPAERGTLLDQACSNSPALRQRVERLLADEGHAESFFTEEKTGESDNRTVLSPPVPPAAGTELEGKTIGRYKLLQKLGEGGFLKPSSRR